MSLKASLSLSPGIRVALSLLLPPAGGLLFTLLVSGSASFGGRDFRQIALQLAGAGLVSWFLGWRWYGLKGLGLRLGRPLFASIGFSALAWVAFLIARLATVAPGPAAGETAGAPFIFLLLFEAFCVQLWSFGLFFRSVADWRGPLTGAVAGGILFGAIAFLTFQEAYALSSSATLYFVVWGILYGIIRLRTGSFLGATLVQALQSWTAWQLFPVGQPDPNQLRNLYLVASILYAVIIWRLWPKEEGDYRV
jgi:hypothetical protein